MALPVPSCATPGEGVLCKCRISHPGCARQRKARSKTPLRTTTSSCGWRHLLEFRLWDRVRSLKAVLHRAPELPEKAASGGAKERWRLYLCLSNRHNVRRFLDEKHLSSSSAASDLSQVAGSGTNSGGSFGVCFPPACRMPQEFSALAKYPNSTAACYPNVDPFVQTLSGLCFEPYHLPRQEDLTYLKTAGWVSAGGLETVPAWMPLGNQPGVRWNWIANRLNKFLKYA